MSTSHRKVPSRASLPRRTTRGPLDEDDGPLSATLSPVSPSSPGTSTLPSPHARSEDTNPLDVNTGPFEAGLTYDTHETATTTTDDKDLSFLLDASIYHPLSQLDIPVPFRRPLSGPPPPNATPAQALAQVNSLLAKCDFLGAAHLSAICLTSGTISATDHVSIFKLLATRYSCLELLGQVLLAAQEAKALEDLSSEFYYFVPQEPSPEEVEAKGGARPLARHIMPFSLRVQATRLQNIGFSDPRRGVTALYDLGFEAREYIASPWTSDSEKQEWGGRLQDLGMHVVNALIELGDLDCAARTLQQGRPQIRGDDKAQAHWLTRIVLVLVKLGQLGKAKSYVDELSDDGSAKSVLHSIFAVADGDIDAGAAILEKAVVAGGTEAEVIQLARQNLAVAYLYLGRISEARKLLEEMVDDGYSFTSLTVNLATIFDLTSDRSRDQKAALVNKLAAREHRQRAFTNADFKL